MTAESVFLGLRLPKQEKDFFESRAKEAGISVQKFIRKKALQAINIDEGEEYYLSEKVSEAISGCIEMNFDKIIDAVAKPIQEMNISLMKEAIRKHLGITMALANKLLSEEERISLGLVRKKVEKE